MLTTLLAALTAALPTQDPSQLTWARISLRFDRDGDGRVTREEIPQGRRRLLRSLDRNGDGVLTQEDFSEREGSTQSDASEPASNPAGLELYTQEVQPILAAHCYECHSEGARRVRAGLKLDSAAAIAKGGASGAVLVPGDLGESLMVEAIRRVDEDFAMPPDEPLGEDEVAIIERWIELGAPVPESGTSEQEGSLDSSTHGFSASELEEARSWWAFQRPVKTDPPATSREGWSLSPIDDFISAKLDEKGLEPVRDADRGSWLRRVTFDLTGLPPTPEELHAFQEDDSADAYERVVDRLLDSPRFAERWGRHWLDVARYAESSGRDSNVFYPHAWRYRDWVIEAFEKDLPFDEFLREQLAGDLLPAEDADDRAQKLIATGFLALGPKSHTTRSPLQFGVDLIDEQVDAISRGMLGLTVSCARCHDHKFDPIHSEDYYALAGILASTRTLYGTFRSPANQQPRELIELPDQAHLSAGPTMTAELREFYEDRLLSLDAQAEPMRAMEEMDDGNRFRIFVARSAQTQLLDLLERFDDQGRPTAANRVAMGVAEGRPRNLPVLIRGEIDSPGEIVHRGFPEVLCDDSTPFIRRGSGRLELANWIASKENPLTARVWVNRVWSKLFGRGIVASTDNFGKSGELPTHPELLDWLAVTFVEEGWSTRGLIRSIVLSRTYRLDTRGNEHDEESDPDDLYLWRMPARRLEAEAMRDALLFVAGELELERPAGSPINLIGGSPRGEGVLRRLTEDTHVRSVYLPILRDHLPHALECFDAADPSFVTGTREVTLSATQALFLMNDESVMEAADAFASRLQAEAEGQEERIDLAFERALSRLPTPAERNAVLAFLRDWKRMTRRGGKTGDGVQGAWSAFAQALFQSAEFRYRG